jgi:D-beta-D-heptose 7-phosphate kinase/D-beta-D-heptose 1-phosphate adenosyltransferase
VAVIPMAALPAELAPHRAAGHRIVFTNGCFDVLHRGHVSYLQQARTLGDILVVGVNDDASVRRLKGPHRPINSAEDRAAVLAALECVGLVTIFSGDDAVALVEIVCPDVYVKGTDYRRRPLPEAATVAHLGGRVELVDLLDGRSTTAIVERIRAV